MKNCENFSLIIDVLSSIHGLFVTYDSWCWLLPCLYFSRVLMGVILLVCCYCMCMGVGYFILFKIMSAHNFFGDQFTVNIYDQIYL